MATADENAAEKIGSAIEGQIYRLNQERSELLKASVRIAEIDAELVVLTSEKARIDPRRARTAQIPAPPIDDTPTRTRT